MSEDKQLSIPNTKKNPTATDSIYVKNYGKILEEKSSTSSLSQETTSNQSTSQVSGNKQALENGSVSTSNIEISKKLAQFKYSNKRGEETEFITPSTSVTELMVNSKELTGSHKQKQNNDLDIKDLDDQNIENLVGLLDLNQQNSNVQESQSKTKDFDAILLQASKKRKRSDSSEFEISVGDKAILMNVQTQIQNHNTPTDSPTNTEGGEREEVKKIHASSTNGESPYGTENVSDNEGKQVEITPKSGVTVTIDNGKKHVSFQTDVETKDDLHLPPPPKLFFSSKRQGMLN